MHEFDHFMKHELRVKDYFRYTDDFVVVSPTKGYLEDMLPPIARFLKERLSLELHPQKVAIRALHQGVDFLGYNVFPNHRLVRTKTRRRIFKKFRERIREYHRGDIGMQSLEQSLQSYLGVLSHANGHALRERLKNEIWFWT